MQDTLATFDAITTVVYAAVPWLVAGTVLREEPVTPYQGKKPYMVISSPTNSRYHGLSQTVGNKPGVPNLYLLAYYESIYVPNAQRQTEKDRVYQTYDAIGIALVQPSGEEDEDFPASDLSVAGLELVTERRGPFVSGPDGLYIGALLLLYLWETYDG